MRKVKILVASIAFPYLAGAVGASVTVSSLETWYKVLNKPAFNPPSWVFAPVWNILYLLMGIALYLIWIKSEDSSKEFKSAFKVFLINLVLNSFWSIAFFGIRSPLLALIVIIALLGIIGYLIILFYRLNKLSGLLLIPYILWVSFATVLNFAIWRLN